ncbi:MAG: endolytic transglycosylase MltG [Terracidiphilus sp.]
MAPRRRTSRRKKGSGAWALRAAAFFLVLGAGAAAWLVLWPFGPSREIFVEFAPGSSTLRIGQQLEAAGVVRSEFAFDVLRWIKRGTLKAGEYRFDHPAPATEVYARIVRGDVFTKTVVVPEGSSIFDIGARLELAGFGTRQGFVDGAAKQVGLVADLDPGAKSLEGYLFPDTYHFPRTFGPPQICAAMVRRFRAVAGQLGLKGNVHRVVTMASLVERETAVDAERPLVAGVFENRLAKRMPLMTDPAVIYGLEVEGRWRGAIHQSDLKFDTPYNTYLHIGLPPGPVANPGLKSLRAAMQPAKSTYLYFVAAGANPQGRSLFASSEEEHEHNVAGYRHAMKKAGER